MVRVGPQRHKKKIDIMKVKHVNVTVKMRIKLLRRFSALGNLNDSENASKSKSVPLQAWSDPEGSRKSRFPDFMTTAQGGGKVVSLTHRPHLPRGNSPGTHFC